MSTVIIEDEQLIAEELEKNIKALEPGIQVLATLGSLKQARKWFETHSLPDLLFMDIQLSDGVSFELFNHFTIDCPIIFTTAYNEYAIRAFKVNSIDYLLKPIDRKELEQALQKYKRLRAASSPSYLPAELAAFINNFNKPAPAKIYKQRFSVHIKNTLSPIGVEDIACIVKDEIIYVYTNDNQRFIIDYSTMEEVEELLDPTQFYRANRQYIININVVDNYKGDYSGKLFVKLKSPLNISIDISREKAQAFKKWVLME